ncbi:MAG: hypothetical protein JXA82_18765 [Sedimentisphaerales bacterium]|nr:hypothetical protein [Sedimentisphaerales bacterium]
MPAETGKEVVEATRTPTTLEQGERRIRVRQVQTFSGAGEYGTIKIRSGMDFHVNGRCFGRE